MAVPAVPLPRLPLSLRASVLVSTIVTIARLFTAGRRDRNLLRLRRLAAN
jgi:hypothetical protein